MIPTSAHFEGFFHGMAHSQRVAGQTVRGISGARAIGREQATLKLLKEQYDLQNAPKSDVRYDFASHYLSPYLPKDTGAPAFGETGKYIVPDASPAERATRRIRDCALIAMSVAAVIMLFIHIVVSAAA